MPRVYTRTPAVERIAARSVPADRGYITLCSVFPDSTPGQYCTVTIPVDGGGQFSDAAHIVVWEAKHGPVPAGHHVHHLCHQRDCHEESHLTVRSPRAHRREHTRSRCPRYHPLAGPNLYIRPDGARACRQCKREQQRARRAAA